MTEVSSGIDQRFLSIFFEHQWILFLFVKFWRINGSIFFLSDLLKEGYEFTET